MRTQSNKATKDLFIDITLELIEERGGCRGVNLRQIAQRVGIAHTGIYNYFASLEDLYWAALDRALQWQTDYISEHLEPELTPDMRLKGFLEAQVIYAQKHPALYRLFWIENLEGTPPDYVLKRLDRMRSRWLDIIGSGMMGKISPQNMTYVGQVIHGYFHGEMCVLVGRKGFITSKPDPVTRIVANTMRLIELLAASEPGNRNA